jgi:glutamyl-tRNA synthetase
VTDRVRFAPSPTGFLHVGSARTALFNWLHARSVGGRMLLRIEDTDTERNRPELIEVIFRELEWLGIDWDEGPYFQSERLDLHRAAVERLLVEGRAYLCDADNREVPGTALRDGLAVRFRTPDEGVVGFTDLIRDEVSFACAELEDFVVWRSNGTPTFLLANAVDDADMAVTHAIRGEDLLSSAPKVLLLLDALGLERPTYAHLPLLVNEQRKKLSKRRDDVSIADYRTRGYLPEAMANYLALLGWGPPDDVEIRPMEEIVALFRIGDVNKASAFFDVKKLEHVNATYLRELPTEAFLERVEPWVTGTAAPWPPGRYDRETLARMLPLIQEKLRLLADTPRFVDFLFLEEPVPDEASWQATMVKGPAAAAMLDGVIAAFETCGWEPEVLKQAVNDVGEANGLKLGKAQAPVRVAVTGRTVGPPLFETMALFLDRALVLHRLRVARARL